MNDSSENRSKKQETRNKKEEESTQKVFTLASGLWPLAEPYIFIHRGAPTGA
jgi:hypothetical protein